MKYHLFIVLSVCLSGLIACKKDVKVEPEQPREIFLKEVSQSHLPSPSYYFEYDNSGHVNKASLSSGQSSYEVLYDGNFITELKNTSNANRDRIQYLYNSKKNVELIKVTNEQNGIKRLAELTYDSENRLTKMEWEVKIDGMGLAREQTLQFSYNAHGNMVELRRDRHFIEDRQTAAVYIDRFEQFDNMLNVNDFEHLHLQDNHLLLLPGVHLQWNNPLKNVRTGDGLNYEINYSYLYSNSCPVQKNGDMLYTNGPDAGKHFNVGYTFTYY